MARVRRRPHRRELGRAPVGGDAGPELRVRLERRRRRRAPVRVPARRSSRWIARGAWDLLALRTPLSWRRAIGAGFLLLVVVDIVNLALDPFLHPGREQGLTPSKWEPQHAGAFALFAFSVVVLAPLTEELAFRGLGFGLLRPFGLVPPIAGSAILWAFAHGLLEALPVIVAARRSASRGFATGRTARIPGMVIHATFNGLALAASLLV